MENILRRKAMQQILISQSLLSEAKRNKSSNWIIDIGTSRFMALETMFKELFGNHTREELEIIQLAKEDLDKATDRLYELYKEEK